MEKPISTKQHGLVDYAFTASLLVLSRVLPGSDGVKRALRGTALATFAMSALTRYEIGVFKVLPMRGHVALDLVTGPAFMAAPLLFTNEQRSVKGTLAALGAVGTSVALLTQTERSDGA